jgi:hypothetical protein
MFEVSSDIYFVVYNLYYIDQNDDLGIRARPINRDEGSIKIYVSLECWYFSSSWSALKWSRQPAPLWSPLNSLD